MEMISKKARFLLLAGLAGITGISTAGVDMPVPYTSQPDDQTCLPTSLMMALNYMGRIDDFSSDTIQMLQKQTQYNRFNVPEIVKKYNLYALPNWHNLGWTHETIEHELDMGRPVILGLNQGRGGHFVLAVGYTDDGRVIVNDPSRGTLRPGLGGEQKTVVWKDILWRGGVILRPTPFPEPPPMSGVAVEPDGSPLEDTINLRLTSGEDREVSFTLVNNGRVPWPKKLYLAPVDPDSSPTKAMKSPMAVSDWISSDRVMEALSGLKPQTTGTISFHVKAPDVAKTKTELQYFQLVDSDGNWFGTNWLTGPGNRNMGVRIIVLSKDRPKVDIPLVGGVKDGKPTLPWRAKFGEVKVDDENTTPPPNDGKALRLLTPGHYLDSAWLGDAEWKDYRIEAWVWCDLRPEQKPQGWERVGIFAHDNGQHVIDSKTELERGHGLAMTFDSDDGSLRAGNVINGSIRDFRTERFHIKDRGWHHFAISCQGSTVSYELDGKPFHTEKNANRFLEGDCGVYYRSTFKKIGRNDQGTQGIIFSGLKITKP